MALIKLKIFGIKINDTLSFKIVFGGICIILLLALLGPQNFYDWSTAALITYIATILLIVSVTNFFVSDEPSTRDLIMCAAGGILLLVSCAKTYNSLTETGISVIKAFVWATVFSIIIETGKKHMKRVEDKVKRIAEPRENDFRREITIGTEKVYRDPWDGKIGNTSKINATNENRTQRKPYIK
jgi:membrane-bound ClpP family serine protease